MSRLFAETNPDLDTTQDAKTLRIQPWNVSLFDDNDHTFEYVIHMLCKILNVNAKVAGGMAQEVHTAGRVVVFTGSRERCELIQQQIQTWGADPLVPWCKGSMSAAIEKVD